MDKDGEKSELSAINEAVCQFQLEMYRKCMNSCKAILKEYPSSSRALILLGKSLRELQHQAEAARAFEDAIEACRLSSDTFMMLIAEECMCLPSKAESPQHVGITCAPVSSTAEIEKLCKQFIGSGSGQIDSAILRRARGSLSNATGENLLDDMIAFGYLQVNVGNLDTACLVFKTLLDNKPNIIAAHLGLGSAFALKGCFDEAIESFSSAILLDGTLWDAWKRRGQTKMAKGLFQDAILDFTRSIDMGEDSDSFVQRGVCYYKMNDFRRALNDFRRAQKKGEDSADLHNQIGMTKAQLGDVVDSISSYKKVVRCKSILLLIYCLSF